MAAKLASVFLAIAVVALFAAWRLQSSAGDALADARRIQNLEAPESGAEPASVEDYEAIVRSLDRSIAIRGEIDGLLSEVERIIGGLNRTQASAVETAEATRGDIEGIGRTLDGTIDASREARGGLVRLRERLSRSAILGKLIADELEELDRSLGPPVSLP